MRVLGPVELVDGTSVVSLPQAQRTVLAALAARLGERVAVDELAEALWSNGLPPSARKSLQAHIARLRHVVGATAIVEHGGGYRLDPDVVEVDADTVTAMVEQAREARRHGETRRAIALLDDARAAFRGFPYQDVPEAAVPAGEVQRLADLRVTISEESAEAELVRGSGDRCVAELEALVQANPYRERAWALLMRALYQAGRSADALAAFGRARLLLAEELGIEPGPTLREAERAILAHDPSLAPATGVQARRLGRSNLPAAVSPIVGRQLELALLGPSMMSERLVTLTGVGGIGKTRLAVELAAQARAEGRVPFFIDLAPIGDVSLVLNAVAVALGVEVAPLDDVMAKVNDALADRSVEIVFDNCEHLLPDVAEVIAKLLATSSGARVLATSREALGIPGERVCPVDPLPVPAESASAIEIAESDAGALFLARLPMNLSTGPLSQEEFAAVGEICRTVEGIPLGLELAAARCLTMSLVHVAERLHQSIDQLAPPRHGAVARHRTIAAALDWGFALLTPHAQAALRAMSVFADGCTASAFAAVCIDDTERSAGDVLDELVRTSFTIVERDERGTRYRLLEPVRQYAAALLQASGADVECHRRHLHHCLALARSLTNDIDHVGWDTQWVDLRPELGNFRVALDWAAGDAASIDDGLRLLTRLWDLWTVDGHHQEALERADALLRRDAGSAAARSAAAYAAGFIADDLGTWDRSLQLWTQALEEAHEGDDRVGEARARRLLCSIAFAQDDFATAQHHAQTAIQLSIEAGNHIVHAHCLTGYAKMLGLAGLLDAACELLHQALDGPSGSIPSVETSAQLVAATVQLERGDFDAARRANSRVLELAEAHGMSHLAIMAHLRLAGVECAVGNPDGATAHLGSAAALIPDVARGWDSWILGQRADIALVRGHTVEALRLAEEAAALADQINNVERCWALVTLGDAQLANGEHDRALATFEQLIDQAGLAPMRCRQADGHEGAAAACAALGRRHEAHEHSVAAIEIRRVTRSKRIPCSPVTQRLADLAGDAENLVDARSRGSRPGR